MALPGRQFCFEKKQCKVFSMYSMMGESSDADKPRPSLSDSADNEDMLTGIEMDGTHQRVECGSGA